jgi:membrane-bound ClpP family serine protease
MGFVYIVLLVIGVVYAVIAGALGWLGDLGGGDIHVDMSGHLDAGQLHPISGPVMATFVTGFGAGGTVAHYLLHWPLLGGVGLATAVGALLAGGAFLLMATIFKHTQSGSEYTVEDVVGREVEIITSIPPGGTGEVAYIIKGQREVGPARSTDGAPIAKGQVVIVEKVQGPTLYVRARS